MSTPESTPTHGTCMYHGQPDARDDLIDFIPLSGTKNLASDFNPGVFRHREIWGSANVQSVVVLYMYENVKSSQNSSLK